MNAIRRPANSIQVKICGLTNAADAHCAIDCGANALGFNFYPGSRRFLDFELARHWLKQLPPGVSKVAVLVNPTRSEAMDLARTGMFDSLQLHGNEPPEFCRELADSGIRFTKAIAIPDHGPLPPDPKFFTDTILLDALSATDFGGTGRSFSWTLGRRFVNDHPELRVILAGGLTPDNVAQAIGQVRPFGVDVTTGVESSPGRKDPNLLRAFISAVRES